MHGMANTRGWFLLDMLSREIGRGRLDAMLRQIISEYSGKAISFSEFEQHIERSSPRDIKWLFDDWFERTGAPTYKLDWSRTTDGITGRIAQTRPVFRATLPLELRGPNGRRQVSRVWVNDTVVSFHLRTPFIVREVLLDPDYEVLRWTPELRRAAVARAPFVRADFERRFGNAKHAVELFRLALDSVPGSADTTSLTFSMMYGFALAVLTTSDSALAYTALQQAIALPARNAASLPRAYLLLARLAHARGETELAVRATRAAVAADAIAGNKAGVAEIARALPWMSKLAPP